MNIENAGNAENETIYDLIIIGQGLQASLVLLHAAEKGLQAILVSENDGAENQDESPFCLIEPVHNHQIFKIRFRNRLINSFKKSFSYLFIDTKIDNYQSITLVNRLFLIIHKYLFQGKIEIIKKRKYSGFNGFSYSANKFSNARLTLILLKKAVQLGAKLYSYSYIKLLEANGNHEYQIKTIDKITNQELSLKSKCVVSFDLNFPIVEIDKNKKAEKALEAFYFTYPINKLKLEKNRIIRNKHQELKIITWFDLVYFEFSYSETKNISLDEVLIFIDKYYTDIQIVKSEIQSFGTFKKVQEVNNKEKVQCVYLANNKQIKFSYKSINQWFDYSNSICNSIVESIKKGKIGKSPIGSMSFLGNDLPQSDNPLRMMEFADEKFDQAKQILKSPVYFKKLFYRYGSQIDWITNKAYENWNETKNSHLAWLKAEIWYSIEHEFCRTAKDFIHNRTEEWMKNNPNKMEEIELIFKELSN